MTKLLITGSNGMVGQAFRKLNIADSVFLTRKDADLTDFNSTKIAFNILKPEKVITKSTLNDFTKNICIKNKISYAIFVQNGYSLNSTNDFKTFLLFSIETMEVATEVSASLKSRLDRKPFSYLSLMHS